MEEVAKVLFLDDEPNILHLVRRVFMDDAFDLLTCSSGAEGLDVLKRNDVAVIVSDNLMPGMRGIEFLQKAKTISPDSVRIMITGYADAQVAIDAINKGEVYKFMTKPWNDGELRAAILHSIDKHEMVRSLLRTDEYSLRSIAQTIELKDPYIKGHSERVAKYALLIAEELSLEKGLKADIEHGSWLHDCGKIGVPEEILNCPGPLSTDQMCVVKKHPHWGADVARLAHLPETVINIILYHHERFDGKGYPTGLKGEAIPVEARIVNVADIYDALTSDRSYRERLGWQRALQILHGNRGSCSDPHIVDTLVKILRETGEVAR